MSARWSFGSTPIFVSDDEIAQDVYRAELKILDATANKLHYYGAGSKKHHLKGLVIGSDAAQLLSDAINNISRTFTTNLGVAGTYKINGTPKFTRRHYAGGTIDGVSYDGEVTALLDVELELIEIL